MMERRVFPAFVMLLGSVCLALLMLVSSGAAQAPVNPPNLITGSDIGFMVEGQMKDRSVNGRWMVRVKGEWVPVGGGPGLFPVK